MVSIDTHVFIWLGAGEVDRLSSACRDLLEREAVGVSPAVLCELHLLRELGRINFHPSEMAGDLRLRIGVAVLDDPFEKLIPDFAGLNWTRDPFDRLITAHARFRGIPLITKDRHILEHFPAAVW